MRRFIAWRNIERYKRLLACEPTQEKRAVLERLLAEEQVVWAGMLDDGEAPEQPKVRRTRS